MIFHAGVLKQLDSSLDSGKHAILMSGLNPDYIHELILSSPRVNTYAVHTLRPEKDAKSIGIEQLRKSLQHVMVKQTKDSARMLIITDANLLTEEAQNTLLKTLEEPPRYSVIILISPTPQDVLTTILSRCIQITVKPISVAEAERAYPNIGKKDVTRFVFLAEGNPQILDALLQHPDHSILAGYAQAKEFLASKSHERLIKTELYKQNLEELTNNLKRIASATIASGTNKPEYWYNVMRAASQTTDYIQANISRKLATLYLILQIS